MKTISTLVLAVLCAACSKTTDCSERLSTSTSDGVQIAAPSLTLTITREGKYFVQARRDSGDNGPVLSADGHGTAAIKDLILKAGKYPLGKPVYIRADTAAPFGAYVDAVVVLSDIGLRNMAIVTKTAGS